MKLSCYKLFYAFKVVVGNSACVSFAHFTNVSAMSEIIL